MNGLQHFTNVYVAMDLSKWEYQVKVDRARAAELGVSATEVADSLRTLVAGTVATRWREGDTDYDIRVMVPEAQVSYRGDLENLRINTAQGGDVRLIDLAQVRAATGPVEIVREDQVKTVIVRGDAVGVSVGDALAELQAAMAQAKVPLGYRLSYGGQAQMMSEMARDVLDDPGVCGVLFLHRAGRAVRQSQAADAHSRQRAVLLAARRACCSSPASLWGPPSSSAYWWCWRQWSMPACCCSPTPRSCRWKKGLRCEKRFSRRRCCAWRPRIMVTTAILIGFAPLALALEAGGTCCNRWRLPRRWPADGECGVAVPDARPVSDGEPGDRGR